MTTPENKQGLRGWHVLAMLVAFFGVIIAVNVIFMTLAIGTFPGEDERRSYVQGIHYNDKLDERRAQAELGWRVGAALGADRDGPYIEVVVRSHEDEPVYGLNVSGELRRPAESDSDKELQFVEAGEGRYVARLDELSNGAWRLRARAEDARSTTGEARTGEVRARDFERSFTWRSNTPSAQTHN